MSQVQLGPFRMLDLKEALEELRARGVPYEVKSSNGAHANVLLMNESNTDYTLILEDEDVNQHRDIFERRATVGLAPGWLVILVGVVYNSLIVFVAFSTMKLRDSSSEVLPLESFEWHPLKQVSDWAGSGLRGKPAIRRSKKARQRMRSIHKTES